jgi:hypothetical protein
VAQREVPHDVEQGALERVWRPAQVEPDDDGVVDWVQRGDHALLGWHHEVPRGGVLQVDDAKRGERELGRAKVSFDRVDR